METVKTLYSLIFPRQANAQSQEMSRTGRLLLGASSSVLGKGSVLLANVASVPIMVRYLGVERFGIWVTISSAFSMLMVFDLGIASALVNFISEAYADEDRARASLYSTTGLTITLAIGLVLGGVALWLWPAIRWMAVFHLSSVAEVPLVSHACAAAFVAFLVGLPTGLAAKILAGYQELYAANLFIAAGSLSGLVAIVLLVWLRAGLVSLVAASSGALVGANLLCLLWLWWFRKPWLAPRAAHLSGGVARQLLRSGGAFFMLQIAYLLAFNTDNLIVMHYLGPAQVACYSVAWRLTGFASLGLTLMTPSLWPAYREAFTRNDLPWVRRTFFRTLWTSMSVALALTILLAFAGRRLIRIWASPAAVPSEALLLLMCGWVLLSVLMSNTAVIVAGTGQIRVWTMTSVASALLNVALSVYWVQTMGAAGVVMGTIVSYLVFLIGPQIWQCYHVLKEDSAR